MQKSKEIFAKYKSSLELIQKRKHQHWAPFLVPQWRIDLWSEQNKQIYLSIQIVNTIHFFTIWKIYQHRPDSVVITVIWLFSSTVGFPRSGGLRIRAIFPAPGLTPPASWFNINPTSWYQKIWIHDVKNSILDIKEWLLVLNEWELFISRTELSRIVINQK